MTATCDLSNKHCVPCEGGTPALTIEEAASLAKSLHADWSLSDDGRFIRREFKFRNFAKTVYFLNMVIWMADKEMHHPDVEFGYGYCHITYSTHAIDGLSENDYICAAKIDALIE